MKLLLTSAGISNKSIHNALVDLLEKDALLVGGGDCQYLCYWMQQSGLTPFAIAAAQDGLRRLERREYGDDSLWNDLQKPYSASRKR